MADIFLLMFMEALADIYSIQGRKIMLTLIFGLSMMGYGAGYEGYNDGKLYVGLYTPSREYGYVVTEREIYLDTVLVKK